MNTIYTMLVDENARVRWISHTSPGVDKEEVVGKVCWVLLPPEHQPQSEAIFRSLVRREKDEVHSGLAFRHPDGEKKDVKYFYFTRWMYTGIPGAVVCIMSKEFPYELTNLSDRELEILLLAGAGMPVKEIAEEAFISDATVRTHLQAIRRKLSLDKNEVFVFAGHYFNACPDAIKRK